jgi:hypothetical protein
VDNIEIDIKQTYSFDQVSTGLGYRPVVGFYERNNGYCGSIEDMKVFTRYQCLESPFTVEFVERKC